VGARASRGVSRAARQLARRYSSNPTTNISFSGFALYRNFFFLSHFIHTPYGYMIRVYGDMCPSRNMVIKENMFLSSQEELIVVVICENFRINFLTMTKV
jgi:hypothetical protein